MKTKVRYFIIVAILVFLLPTKLWAATLYFNSPKNDFMVGEQFTATLVVDSLSEAVNAFEGKLIFPDELLAVKEIFIGNSIINFWVDLPKAEKGEIKFSGIVPGGYMGDKGQLFSVVFMAKSSGYAEIKLTDGRLLLNDGQGTSASVAVTDLSIKISPNVDGQKTFEYLPFSDGVLPEEFTPELSRSPEEFGGRWFVVFSAQDKGSGIDYYEVCEGNQNQCEKTDSPYILKDQNLSGKIFVKAVDKRGNGRIVVLKPPRGAVWYEKYQVYVIIVLLLFASFFVTLKRYVSWRG